MSEAPNGDYGTLEEVESRTSVVIKDVVNEWETKCERHFGYTVPTLVFTRSIEQGRMIVDSFNANGHRFSQVHSGDDHHERLQRIEDFRNGDLDGLVSVDVLAEGFDVPSVKCVLFARPTGSITRLIQAIGRGQRVSEGKDHCLVLDMSESVKRELHTLSDHWSVGPTEFVSGEGKESRPAPAKECPECHAIVPAATMVCPECGHQFPAPEPEETLDGRLVQLLRSDYGRMSTQELAEAMGDAIGLRYGREIGWGCACETATEKAGDRGRLDLTYTIANAIWKQWDCLLYTSPSPRD